MITFLQTVVRHEIGKRANRGFPGERLAMSRVTLATGLLQTQKPLRAVCGLPWVPRGILFRIPDRLSEFVSNDILLLQTTHVSIH